MSSHKRIRNGQKFLFFLLHHCQKWFSVLVSKCFIEFHMLCAVLIMIMYVGRFMKREKCVIRAWWLKDKHFPHTQRIRFIVLIIKFMPSHSISFSFIHIINPSHLRFFPFWWNLYSSLVSHPLLSLFLSLMTD